MGITIKKIIKKYGDSFVISFTIEEVRTNKIAVGDVVEVNLVEKENK